MEDKKAITLLQEVVEKTRSGRIPWEQTADEFTYFAVIPGEFVIQICEERNRWGEKHELALALRDRERELLRITPAIDGIKAEQLEELYELARRQSLRVEAKVEKLLGELTRL